MDARLSPLQRLPLPLYIATLGTLGTQESRDLQLHWDTRVLGPTATGTLTALGRQDSWKLQLEEVGSHFNPGILQASASACILHVPWSWYSQTSILKCRGHTRHSYIYNEDVWLKMAHLLQKYYKMITNHNLVSLALPWWFGLVGHLGYKDENWFGVRCRVADP